MRRRSARGVTLVEGLMASVILLVGMVGVFQGVIIASTQNSMANRRSRASAIAAELSNALDAQGRMRLVGSGGLLTNAGACSATYPNTVDLFRGDFTGLPAGYGSWAVCYVDVDAAAAFNTLTPAYSTEDRAIFKRVLAVYTSATDPSVAYVGINVGWREYGAGRVVERFTALYDPVTNQTNVEF
ncbi:MAG: type IV pilus modification PilV family protein [Archangium sp.]